MDNVEEMDRFLKKFKLTRLNQEEIEIMNHPITSTEIKTVIKNLSKNKSPRPDGFTGEFYQTFRQESNAYPSKTLSKNCRTHPNTFYKATITLILKPGKDNIKKDNYRPI